MNKIGILAVSAVSLCLSACATIVTSSNQDIAVTSAPGDQAMCTATNGVGSWTVTTPGSIKVERSKNDLQVSCTKAGFQNAQATGASGFEPWALGNILLGGLIGLGIDWASGSIHKYPNAIQVPLRPSSTGSAQPQGRPTS
jgi:hypothetical protein